MIVLYVSLLYRFPMLFGVHDLAAPFPDPPVNVSQEFR